MQLRHILAATDESEAGRQAVRCAVALGARAPAQVTILRVIPEGSTPGRVALAPGKAATFTARLFDKDGNFLRESPAQWSLPLPPKAPTGAQPP